MPSQNNRRLILILGFFAVLLIVGIIFAFKPTHPNPHTQGQHVDPLSHETVSSPAGKAPDKYGVPNNTPLYLGFDKLLDYGLSTDQLDNVQTAFYRYSQSLPKPIGQISVDVDHITAQSDSSNPNTPFDVLFKVQLDGKSVYQAKAEYFGLDDIRLYLTDQNTKAVIYDSQTLYSSQQSD